MSISSTFRIWEENDGLLSISTAGGALLSRIWSCCTSLNSYATWWWLWFNFSCVMTYHSEVLFLRGLPAGFLKWTSLTSGFKPMFDTFGLLLQMSPSTALGFVVAPKALPATKLFLFLSSVVFSPSLWTWTRRTMKHILTATKHYDTTEIVEGKFSTRVMGILASIPQ